MSASPAAAIDRPWNPLARRSLKVGLLLMVCGGLFLIVDPPAPGARQKEIIAALDPKPSPQEMACATGWYSALRTGGRIYPYKACLMKYPRLQDPSLQPRFEAFLENRLAACMHEGLPTDCFASVGHPNATPQQVRDLVEPYERALDRNAVLYFLIQLVARAALGMGMVLVLVVAYTRPAPAPAPAQDR